MGGITESIVQDCVKVVKPLLSILDKEQPLMYTDGTGMGKSNKK